MGYGQVVTAIAALAWAVGWILLLRGRRTTHRAGEKNASELSIIIPARNEEENLPKLLRSIRTQTIQPAQVIVVDDASTDRTAEIAREFGATVISPPKLPEGWRGKTWACHHGANRAGGNVFLFLDADTFFEDDGLAGVLATYAGGALSVGPWHAVLKPYEQLSVYFNLVMNCAVVPDGLFGQMLLVEKAGYFRAGGHEAVKGRILENLELAEEFRRHGIAVRSIGGRGMLSIRMYPQGLRQLIAGWIKAFSAGATQTPLGVLLAIILWLTGMMLAASLLPLGWGGVTIYLLFVIQAAVAFFRVGLFRWHLALIYPIPLVFFFGVFALSALRSKKPVMWKGRTIRAD